MEDERMLRDLEGFLSEHDDLKELIKHIIC